MAEALARRRVQVGARRVTRLANAGSATVEIASVVCRIACRYEKPIAWAGQQPAFLCAGPPDATIDLTYERRQRALPWLADGVVADAPVIVADGDRRHVRTSYYDAIVTGDHVRVRMQPGFGVDGLMRTLWALFLLPRDGFLVRGDRDGPSVAVPGTDILALLRRPDGWIAFATPFGAEASIAANEPSPVRSVRVAGDHAIAALARHVYAIDRSPDAVERMLELMASALGRPFAGASHG